jgi:FemAB-related protein (PEP-CTERM system-associated)
LRIFVVLIQWHSTCGVPADTVRVQLATQYPEKSTAVEIRSLEVSDFSRWDDFVFAHPHGSPFHLIAWKKSIEEAFGYTSWYLTASEGSHIRGIVPLFLVNNPLMGKVLLSSPFAVYGGILADSEGVRQELGAYIKELGARLGVQYVELRNAWREQSVGFTPVNRYVTFTQQIGPDDELALQAIPRKTRYMVRKALKEDFSVNRLHAYSGAFFDLYSRNLRRLGTPCFPSRYFSSLLRNFGDLADIREIVLNEKVVAAVLTFYFRDQVLPYYGASDPVYNAAAPNNFMYFHLMSWGGSNGFSLFDFGRSKKTVSGSYDFKAHWGMLERELPYEVLLLKRKELPHYSPANPRFGAFVKFWQRVPLSLTRAVGPMLVKWVP